MQTLSSSGSQTGFLGSSGGIGSSHWLMLLASLFLLLGRLLDLPFLNLLYLPTTLTVLAPQVASFFLPVPVSFSLMVFVCFLFLLNLTVFFWKRLDLPPCLTWSLTLVFDVDLTLRTSFLAFSNAAWFLVVTLIVTLAFLFFFASALFAASDEVKANAISNANASTAMRRTFTCPEWWFILLYSSLWFVSADRFVRVDKKFMCDLTHRY